MTVKEINHALVSRLKREGDYAGLVHDLFELDCSDELITAIVTGSLGEAVRDRVAPIIAMVRAYENLSSSEQIDTLYSIIEKQDSHDQNNALKKKMTA